LQLTKGFIPRIKDRLKKLLADSMLNNAIVKNMLGKSELTSATPRYYAAGARAMHAVAEVSLPPASRRPLPPATIK
jgi:hypothetical protein